MPSSENGIVFYVYRPYDPLHKFRTMLDERRFKDFGKELKKYAKSGSSKLIELLELAKSFGFVNDITKEKFKPGDEILKHTVLRCKKESREGELLAFGKSMITE